MKKRVVCGVFCLALLLLPGGCSNSVSPSDMVPMQIEGVNVDVSQLGVEFAKATPELQSRVTEGVTKLRYKQYLKGMMALDEVLNGPGLNDKQKQILTKVIGQLKEVIAKAGPGNP
jgi:hypothetical protein